VDCALEKDQKKKKEKTKRGIKTVDGKKSGIGSATHG
jgi:hypothetical protein